MTIKKRYFSTLKTDRLILTRESYKQGGRRSSTADMGLFPILTSNKKKTVYTNGRPPWYSLQTGLKSEGVAAGEQTTEGRIGETQREGGSSGGGDWKVTGNMGAVGGGLQRF